MQFVRGILRAVIRYTVMCQRNLRMKYSVCYRNLERCDAKYGNVSEDFRNTECSLSQDFREL
jgi:hypothetical protein